MSQTFLGINTILDSLSDHAVLTLDLQGNVTSWNKAAQKLKGYKHNEIIGQNFELFYDDKDRIAGVPRQVLEETLKNGRSEREGWRYRKTGERFWANVIVQPLRDETDQITGFVKITRDISDRLELEKLRDEAYQSQKLDLVGQLTGGIAHDFNNLLTVFESSYELLKLDKLDQKTHRIIEISHVALERSRKLISQLLAFSRRQVLRAEPHNVNVLARVFDTLIEKAVGDLIEVVWNLDDLLPETEIDAANFQSALMNLIINARDAMPSGGRLQIESRAEIVNETFFLSPYDIQAGKYIVVSVSDTGVGMTPEVAQRAVEPFFTTKEIGKGSGLGLSQCFGFARQCGGTLNIQTKAGEGTVVSLWLPLVATSKMPSIDQRTVLLVEDDYILREVSSALLEQIGYRVIAAADAVEAFSIIKNDMSIDILFTDIVMPGGIDGIELLKRAREIRPDLSAVVTSGYAKEIWTKASALPRNTPFLQKPYNASDLRANLQLVFDGIAPS